MAIKISCDCGKKLSVNDELAGRWVKCPACQQTLSVPKPQVLDEMFDDEQDPAEDQFLFDDEPAESSTKPQRATKSAANWSVSWEEDTPDDAPSGRNLGLLIGLSIGGAGLAMALLAWMLLPDRPADNVAGKPGGNVAGNPVTSSGDAESRTPTTGSTQSIPTHGSATDGPVRSLSQLAADSPHAVLAQIKDAANETAFAGMVSEERSVPWTKPDDLVLDDTFQSNEPPKDLSKVNSFVAGAVMFADGSIRHVHLQEGLDPKMFRALFTISGGEPSPLSKLYLANHKTIQPTYATPQEQVRHAEARTANKNSLKAIAVALHNYQQVFGYFPPATVYGPDGKPWHSWRVVILPYLGQKELYDKYDSSVPWDHPKNAAVLEQMPQVYRDPLSDKPNSNKTPYLVVTGLGTAFPTKPIGNVVAPVLAQPPTAQPAPPKPVAKDGREPIEYQPFRPDVWKAKNQSTWLFPWEGGRIVLLTTTADLDPKTMAVFVKQLDAGWKLCSDLVGQSPRPFRVHHGKATIAAVPDSSFSGGGLVAYLGMTGIEVGGFYAPRGDYDQVRQNPAKFPDGFFFGIGQNHFVFGNQCGVLSTGGIVALRHICAEAINGSDKDPQADQTIYRYEEAFAKSNATFQEVFAPFGATKPFVLNDLDGKPFGNIDLNVFIASTFLKLRKDNGGDEWAKRFFRHLGTCPPAAERDIDGAKAQLLNWVVAASLAAEKDLTSMLRDRWRFPLAPEVWQSLQTVDWKKPGLTADNVFDAMPTEHLLPSIVQLRPSFLTPERRKQNLLKGGTFEDAAAAIWKPFSNRNNNQNVGGAIETGVAKEGQKAVAIRTDIDDDIRFDQVVPVKPGTRYLFSGWIKTKDVVIKEGQVQYGKAGATLSIWGGYEHSRSLTGTNDWTYSTLIFDSGTRTEVAVLARLGYWHSGASGVAWFDDLSLIAIGDSPAGSAAQPRQITGGQTQVVNGGQAVLTLKGHSASVYSVTFSPDGKRLASASINGTVKLWDATSGLETLTLKGHADRVKCVAFSPDGRRLASASLDGTVKLWDSTSGQETLTLKGHTGAVGSVTFSADGKRLASASLDKSVKVWDATSGQATLTLNGHTNFVWSVAFSPDGKRLASASADLTVKVWDASSGQETLTLKGHTNLVDIVVFSPDGKWLASASNDQTIKVWDATSGQEAFTLRGHTGAVYGVAYSPDGTRLASGGFDKTVKVWDARSGQETMTLSGHSEPIMSVAFSPDGKRLASASGDQSVKVWDLTHLQGDDKDRKKAAQVWSKDAPAPAIAPFNAEQAKQNQEAWAKHLGVPVEYMNAIGMKFRLIPPGEFTMGSTPEEMDEARRHVSADDKLRGEKSIKSEGPQHNVILTQPYYLGAHEVRQQDYESVMGVNPSIFSQNGPQPAFRPNFDTSKMPVENVSWINAADFCARLSVNEQFKPTYLRSGNAITPLAGNGYRLPTEAEWEFACRAGTNTRVWFARDEDVSQFVWLANPAGGRPYPAGQLKPNPFGLYDIYGNVCEWVQDGWSPTAYESFGAQSAIDPATAFGTTSERVLRGLVWPFTATGIRSSSRRAEPMTNARHFFGFRAALSVEAVKVVLANPAQAEKPPVLNEGKELLTLKGHSGTVYSATFSKDGKRLASASHDSMVKVWDALSGQEKLTLIGHAAEVLSVAFSPDGKWLASASIDKTVKVWDATSGQERLTLKSHDFGVSSVAFSPDGKRLVSGGVDATVKVWDATNGQVTLTLKGHSDMVLSVTFSPDGKRLASASTDKSVKVWDAKSGQELLTLKGHASHITYVAFSPDGKRLASASADQMVKVWNATSGQESLTLKGHTKGVNSVAFSPDGNRLASASADQTVKVWDATSGQETLTLKGHTNLVNGVAFSPDGNRLASASQDQTVKVWDVAPRPGVVGNATSPQSSAVARQKQADGDKHREQKEYAEAIACYRAVIELEPNNAAILNRLAWVLAVSPQKDQPAGEALKFAQRVNQQQPSNPLYRNSLGAGQYRAGQYAEALSNLVTVANAQPKDFGWLAHNLLFETLCHAKHGDHASAQVAYDKALLLLKQANGDTHLWHEARLLQQEVAALGLFERVPELFTLKGHTDMVLSVAYSPDGKLIASGSRDQSVKLWDAATGKEVRSLKGNLGYVTGLAFSPDSKSLATPSILELKDNIPGDVKLWDVATGQEKALLKGHPSQVWSVSFSADGKRLVSCSREGTLYLWDTTSNQVLQTLKTNVSYSLRVVFSPNGKQLATSGSAISGGDKAAKVWDIASGKNLLTLNGHAEMAGGVAFSPDGKRIVTGSIDKTLKVWDATNGKELLTLAGHTNQVSAVEYSPDGKWIASGDGDSMTKLWDAGSGVEVRTMRGHAAGVSGIAFSPDGKRLVSSSGDQTLKVWDISNIRSISVPPGATPTTAKLAIKPVAISGAPVLLTLQPEHSGFTSVTFSPDGQRLATASIDQPVKVWDATSGQELHTLKAGWCATFSPDGKRLASGGPDKVVRVFDAASGQESLTLPGHTNSVVSVAFSPDGTWLASASQDQAVKVWDATNGKESLTLKGHTGDVRSVVFSPDGKRLASGSRDQTVKLWDATSGRELLTLKGHAAEIRSVAFSPDGKWIASASHDQTVKLWDSASGHLVRTLEGHDSGVMSIAFSPDGTRLASASGDQSAKVWDLASGQVLLTLKGHNSQVVGVALSADGKRLASASYDQTVKVWDVTPGTKPVGDTTATRAMTSREVSPAEMTNYLEASRVNRPLINGDFATGFDGWHGGKDADAFMTISRGGEEVFTTSGKNKDADTGRIYQCFKVPDDATELQFSLHGGADSETTYVALWQHSQFVRKTSARNENTPFPVAWNVMALRGQVVTLEIVDNSTYSWGFLGVQGITLVSQTAPTKPVKDPKSAPLAVDPNQVPLTLKGHSQSVIDVAFSADGTRIASASHDGTVKLWDAVSGQLAHSLKSSASRVSFSPDGKRLATGGYANSVTLWDVATGQATLSLNGLKPPILGVAFAPDGQRLAAGSGDGTLKVWDIANGQETLTVRTPAWQVAFSPDGKQLASASHSDPAVKVWDATTGHELLSLKLPQGGVSSLMFSPDGKRLATSGHPSGPTVWDVSTGQITLTLKAAPWSIAFDPKGQYLATSNSEDDVELFDAANGRPLASLKGHTQRVASIAFSGDGKRIASASDDLTVKVWDLVPGATPPGSPPRPKAVAIPELKPGDEVLTLKGHGGDVDGVVFSADGKRLVTASEDQTVKIWDASDGRELLTLKGHTGPVTCVALTADGKRVASGGRDQLAKLWDATTGRETLSITAGTNYLTSVAFSPDGKRLATAAILTVKVWETANGQEAFDLKGHFANVNSVIFSPDGKQMASCSDDMTVKLRDAANGRETLTLKGHRDAVTGIVFSPDGKRLASASDDQTIKVWDTTTGKELLTLIGHTSNVTDVAMSPNGKRLASVSGDATTRLWDAETGQELLIVKGHSHRVNSVAFSPDGKRLATTSDDRTVKLWDITLTPKNEKKSATSRPMPQKEVDRPVTLSAETTRVTQATQDDPLTVSLKGHGEAVTSVAISPDGKWLASGSSDGVVVWNVVDRKPKFTLRSHGQYPISSVAISPDGKRLAAGVEKVVKVWDAATGAELQSLAGNTGIVNGIAFSYDGKWIASASQDQTVTVWDGTSGKVIDTVKEKLQSFGAVAFSPDGKWLAAGTLSGDTIAKVWNTTNSDESYWLRGHQLYIKSMVFSSDGKRIATASDDGTVKIWDPLSGEDVLTLRDRRRSPSEFGPRPNEMKSVALSLDGKRLVTGGSNGSVTIWDAVTGQKLHSLEGHQGEVRGVAFSPDGKWVASAGADAAVKVWTLDGRPKAAGDGTILKALVDPQKGKSELEALQGTWRLTNPADFANQLPPELAIKDTHLVIKGETATVLMKSLVLGFLLTIDPTQSPKAFDMLGAEDNVHESLLMGIYSLDRDTLQLTLQPFENGRPKGLTPATPPAKDAPNQPRGGGLAAILKFERMQEPLPRVDSIFDLASWQKASRELSKLRVRVHLGRLEPLDLEEPAGPGYIGVVDLPLSETDGTVSADVWKAASSTNFTVCIASGLTDLTLRQLTTHRGLYGLILRDKYSATKDGLALLKACPRFEYVSLTEVPQTVEILTALAESSDLRIIEINGPLPSPELLAAIARFKNVESLQLSVVDLTDDILIELAKLPNLRKLSLPKSGNFNLDKPNVTDKGLQAVKAMKKLKRLEMFGHGIDNLKLHEINGQLRAPR